MAEVPVIRGGAQIVAGIRFFRRILSCLGILFRLGTMNESVCFRFALVLVGPDQNPVASHRKQKQADPSFLAGAGRGKTPRLPSGYIEVRLVELAHAS